MSDIMGKLEELGYIGVPEEHEALFSKNLHGLDYKTYSYKLGNKKNGYSYFEVGIYANYYIHYVESLIQCHGWYKNSPHVIPQATPVKIADLMHKAYVSLNTVRHNSALASKILAHLNEMGWNTAMLLSDFNKIESRRIEYYLKFGNYVYEVDVKVKENTYIVQGVTRVNLKYYRKDKDFSNILPTTKELMKIEINKLDVRRKELEELVS